MIRNLERRFLYLAALTFICGAQAFAQTPTFTIGNQTFSIPTFSKLADMRGDPRVMEWGHSVIEPSTRLLAIFVEKDDPGVKDLTIGRYIVVKTPKKWENATLSKEDFQDLKAVLKRSTANLNGLAEIANSRVAGREAEISKSLNAKMEDMSVGTPLLIEVQRDEDYGYGYTYAARYQANIDGQPRSWITANCSNTLLVKGKLFFVILYGIYQNERDLAWIRNTCQEFANRIVSVN